MAIINQSIMGNPDVRDGAEFEAQVAKFRGHYDTLIEVLGRLGTEVSKSLVDEVDLDIAPHKFVSDAVHRFIFPPQPGLEMIDDPDSGILEGTEPYTLTRVHRACQYDESLVEGEIIIRYDDSARTPYISVLDALGPETSVIPLEAELAVKAALGMN